MSPDAVLLRRALIDYYLGIVTLPVRVQLPRHLVLLTALVPPAPWPVCVPAPKPWQGAA